MCEIDITKLLVSKVKLRMRIHKIEYEGIHLACFNCGIYGHSKDYCKLLKEGGVVVPIVQQGIDDANNGEDANMENEDKELDKAESVDGVIGVDMNPEVLEQFGPWMLVTKKPRKVERKKDVISNKVTCQNGRPSKGFRGGYNLRSKDSGPCAV